MAAQEVADRGNSTLHQTQIWPCLSHFSKHFLSGIGHVVRIAHVQAVLHRLRGHILGSQLGDLIQHLVQLGAKLPTQTMVAEHFVVQHAGGIH